MSVAEKKKSKKKDPLLLNGIRFESKKQLELYEMLRESKYNGFIDDFSFLKPKKPGSHKYNAKNVIIDGHHFDSLDEGRFYIYIKNNQEALGINTITLHPKFTLIDSFTKNGKKYRKTTYTADFLIGFDSGEKQVIDIKGVVTPDFAIKRKLFESRFEDLSLILYKYVPSYGKPGGFIEYDEWMKEKNRKKKQKKTDSKGG